MKTIKYNMIIILSLLLMSISAVAETTQNTIQVTGFAKLEVNNNQGHISTTVSTLALTADEAISENSVIMNNIISELSNAGINNSNLQTSNFSISPKYDWNDNRRVFLGYSVNNSLTITVETISNIGPIIDLLVDAGATRIDRVSFRAENTEEIQSQAMVAATADAFKKATVLAQASSVSLGQAVSITSSATNASIVPSPGDAQSFVGDAVIIPGTNNVYATVTIEYLIN